MIIGAEGLLVLEITELAVSVLVLKESEPHLNKIFAGSKREKMIKELARKIELYFYPPYPGDVYYGDPFEFVIGKPMEQVLHKMRSVGGHEAFWEAVPSEHCVRLTIESDSMPYYRCTSEILATNVANQSEKKWLRRVQPRRILKEVFHQMIIDGRIEKL